MSTNTASAVALGPREVIQGLAAFGVVIRDVFEKDTALQTLRDIRHATASGKESYAVVFIVESLITGMNEKEYQELLGNELPVVLTIPDLSSKPSAGLEKLRALTKRAIGTDILGA